MRPQTSRGPVQFGVIGVGPVWESRYLPALRKLGPRIRVRAVHDAVLNRAQMVASEFAATTVGGIAALAQRPDVRAILLLDNAWYGQAGLELILAARKPVFIAATLGTDRTALQQLHARVQAEGLTIMAEFSRRHTPSSSRLQELMATRLGQPRSVLIEAMQPSLNDSEADSESRLDFLVGLLDWCHYVIRRPPETVAAQRVDHGYAVQVAFRRSASSSEPATAELRIRQPGDRADEASAVIQQQIHCERGHATLRGATEIAWTNGTGTRSEALYAERSDVEVTLDQFCRRVVGGLVPVADLGDVCRGLKLASAVEQSLREQTPVPVGG